MDFSKDDLFDFHASPYFWKFPFQRNDNRKIKPICRLGIQYANTTTCIRIAVKAFEMRILFDFETGGDPTNGTLANSF